MSDPLEAMRGRLVVSCQAPAGSPLADIAHLVALARAAEAGGAAGIRAEGVDSVAAMKQAVGVPVIGLLKRVVPGSDVYITPELDDAREVAAAGADVVAVDATFRTRPGGAGVRDFAGALDVPLLADVDSFEAGMAARGAGAAAVATTLAGYTGGGPVPDGPDVELVRRLAAELDAPVIAEGRYATPADVRAAADAGAFAVVVGTAITDALALTRRFAAALDGETGGGPA